MSPELFDIMKFKLRDLIENDYKLILDFEQEIYYKVKQQHNMVFRHINKITDNSTNFIRDICFVDCNNFKKYIDELTYILYNGFYVNDIHFKMFGKSASMSRNGIIAFVNAEIYEELNAIAMMDLEIKNTVISKFEAYKNLLFSSCYFTDGQLPNIVIVDDVERNIKDCFIKYVVEKQISWEDKDTGEVRSGNIKDIDEGHKDVMISPSDGAGIHSPNMSEHWANQVGIGYIPSVFMIRMPYMKGLSVEVDFKQFYRDNGISKIKDIWGVEHNVEDIDCIWTKSLYKGIKYFKKYGDYRDWERYLEKFKKYNHVLGISKWNFRTEDEPIYTRVNYQYLQTLQIKKEEMLQMAEYTKQWIERIISGDELYTYKFLGISANNLNPTNKYMKALMLHSDMLKDPKVKEYLYSLVRKYIDDIKIGKIWIKGNFKIAVPDLVMLMQYIGGLEPNGCLKANEFYATDLDEEEYLIDRNPHICPSEHAILRSTKNEYTKKYFGRLQNICMLNSYDITMKRLNGCDYDKVNCRFQ